MDSLKKGATLQETVIWTRRGQNSRKKGQMAFFLFFTRARMRALQVRILCILNLESRYTFPINITFQQDRTPKTRYAVSHFIAKMPIWKFLAYTRILARYQACHSTYEINTSPTNIRFLVQPESWILNPVLWLVGQLLYGKNLKLIDHVTYLKLIKDSSK